ncbi:MBL fold metallo-hydrolase [uncultured Desulfosarcina sp.]|uniref:MBL fold metallo-hydrolase n=1 Tax=uncultured Desulfosarcina sp. TaxID=218289 RepID=UPI0029C9A77D|nr:MBL fold metallo-hydrolase [uncultured Desulfosarcina sp.]
MIHFDNIHFLQPVADGIWLAKGPGKSRFPFCNGFLMLGDQTVLVDAGIGADRIREIDRRKRIDTLIISHPHPDHILSWHVLNDRQLFLPAQTPASVGDLRLLGQRFVEGRQEAQYWTWVASTRLGIHPMRQPDHQFDDGEMLDFGAIQLQAIHAPGHLEDHYGFLERHSGTLFSIDIDFTGFGPWYGNPEGDIRRFRDSVMMLRNLPYRQICASHKLPIDRSDADEAFDRYLNAFDRQKAAVFDLCCKGMDLTAMVRHSPLYRNRMPDGMLQQIFETQMIRKNLALLVREGRIVQENGKYRATGCYPPHRSVL